MQSKYRLVFDLGPLLLFFLAFRFAGILAATATLMATTLLSLTIIYIKEKRIAIMPLVSGTIITIFGGLTLFLHDETFIKIKPTVVNMLFAAALLGGVYARRPTLKYVLGDAIHLSEAAWRQLSLRWGLFFIFLAVLNEIVWRSFSTDFWVNFKVFGMFTMTMLFTLCQIPFMRKHWIDDEKSEP